MLFHPAAPPPSDSITLHVRRSFRDALRVHAAALIRWTPKLTLSAWMAVFVAILPTAFVLGFAAYRHQPDLVWLIFVGPAGSVVGFALPLAFQVKSIVLRAYDVVFVLPRGATRVIPNGIKSIEESERFFVVMLAISPGMLTIDKRLLPAGDADVLRHLMRLRAAPATSTTPPAPRLDLN
jgi:hypothetical protein